MPSLEEVASARARPQPDPAARDVHRRLPDAGVGVPEVARAAVQRSRAGVPARVRRPGPRRALLVHRLSPAQGAALVARRPRRSVRARGRRARRGSASRRCPACRRSPAASSACSPTTSSARSSRSASPTRTRSGVPDLALMLTDALVVFDHLKHTVTVIANVYTDERPRRVLRAGGRDDRRDPLAAGRPGPAPAATAGARSRRRPASSRTCRASASRRSSRGSSSTSTPATRSRSSRRSAGRRRCRSRRSRSTAGCGRSTRARTCTSSTSATSRSPARAPSR